MAVLGPQPNRLPKLDLLQAYVSACGAASEWPRWNMAWQTASSFLRRQREREAEARRRLASRLAAQARAEAVYPVDAGALLSRQTSSEGTAAAPVDTSA